MNALIELQRRFLAALRQDSGQASPPLAQNLGLGASGLAIYVHAYAARLREALESDHAILGRYLGDVLWERLCEGYLAGHPSRYRSLRHFGDALPDYLRRAEPFAPHPQLAELAHFERGLLDSFDAADAPRVDWNTLLARPPDEWPALRLEFHPSLRRLRLAWNSVELWQALKHDATPPAAIQLGTAAWALWRDVDRLTRFRSLPTEEAAALDHFADGGDFAQFCATLSSRHEASTVPLRALEYLRRWVQEGWIACWVGAPTGRSDGALCRCVGSAPAKHTLPG